MLRGARASAQRTLCAFYTSLYQLGYTHMQALTSDFELPASLHSELVASHPPSANPQLRAELMAHTHKSPQAGPCPQVTCLSLSQARKINIRSFLWAAGSSSQHCQHCRSTAPQCDPFTYLLSPRQCMSVCGALHTLAEALTSCFEVFAEPNWGIVVIVNVFSISQLNCNPP